MRDQTLGIVGFGKIGTATALKAKGLGMRVIAYDPYVLGAVMESHGVKPVNNMDTLLTESDFISIHTPLTAETTNMIGHREFKKMKRTCYFINTARGDASIKTPWSGPCKKASSPERESTSRWTSPLLPGIRSSKCETSS